MSLECIQDAKLEETGFTYTMSLIQGKYKMFILYTLMEFDTVRFNELKKIYSYNFLQNSKCYFERIRSR